MHLKMSSARCRPFCLGLNVLINIGPDVCRVYRDRSFVCCGYSSWLRSICTTAKPIQWHPITVSDYNSYVSFYSLMVPDYTHWPCQSTLSNPATLYPIWYLTIGPNNTQTSCQITPKVHSRLHPISVPHYTQSPSQITSNHRAIYTHSPCQITPVLHGTQSPCHDDVIKWKHFPRYWPFV